MKRLFRSGLILIIACFTVAYSVAAIEEKEALKIAANGADSFIEKTLGGIEYFEAIKNNKVTGYRVRVNADGYNAHIRMIVGVDLNGIIQDVQILEQNETSGSGSKINEIKPGEKDPYFLRQFKGKNAGSVVLKKNIDAITGATISSNAVTYAINKTVGRLMSLLSSHQSKLGEK